MSEISKTNTAAASEDSIQQKLNREAMRKERLTQLLPYAGIVVLIVLFSILTKGKFVKVKNLNLLLNQSFTMVIVIVGATFLYTLGAMDMALGQVMGVSALVLTVLYNMNVPFVLCLLVSVIVSIGFMCITATAKNYLKLDPFIASLCVSNICSGIVSAVSKQHKVVFPYSKAPWLNVAGVKILVLAGLIIIGYVLYNYTAFGKSLKCIGGSPTVSKISGIRVERTTYFAYIVMGITIGIAALFTVARAGEVDPNIGSSTNLNVMVAIVLGGFPLHGGANARFSAPIIGALMVTILTNGLGMMGQATALGYGIKGLLFVIVIAMTYEKSKGKLVD